MKQRKLDRRRNRDIEDREEKKLNLNFKQNDTEQDEWQSNIS